MYIRFNYRCPGCLHEEERFIKKDRMDRQQCRACTGHADGLYYMRRLPAAPRTSFRFADRKRKPTRGQER